MTTWKPLKIHRLPDGRRRLFVQSEQTRKIRHQPISSISATTRSALPDYRENPKYLTYFSESVGETVARYAQVGDVVYCGNLNFGEVIDEISTEGIPDVLVRLRDGLVSSLPLDDLRVLDNNLVGPPLSSEDKALIESNLRGLRTIAEIEQALQKYRDDAEEFLLQKTGSLGADDVLEAHDLWFGPVFAWGGRLRRQKVRVGRENYETPSPVELESEMDRFDGSLRQAQTLVDDQSLRRSAIWLHMANVYFELCRVHPFRDGNGRLARLLIEAMLTDVAGKPVNLLWDQISRVGAKTRWAFRRARDFGDQAVLATFLFKAYRKYVSASSGTVLKCPEKLRADLCA